MYVCWCVSLVSVFLFQRYQLAIFHFIPPSYTDAIQQYVISANRPYQTTHSTLRSFMWAFELTHLHHLSGLSAPIETTHQIAQVHSSHMYM